MNWMIIKMWVMIIKMESYRSNQLVWSASEYDVVGQLTARNWFWTTIGHSKHSHRVWRPMGQQRFLSRCWWFAIFLIECVCPMTITWRLMAIDFRLIGFDAALVIGGHFYYNLPLFCPSLLLHIKDDSMEWNSSNCLPNFQSDSIEYCLLSLILSLIDHFALNVQKMQTKRFSKHHFFLENRSNSFPTIQFIPINQLIQHNLLL